MHNSIASVAAGLLWLAFTSSAFSQTINRVALLGCIRQDKPLPALETYCDLDADLHLWLGDNIYADTDDPKVIEDC